MDCNRIAQIFAEKVKAEYQKDVAAVVVYGAAEDERKCYFIPKTERGMTLGRAFLVKGHGVEILPKTFAQLAQLGAGDRREIGMLLDAEVIYTASEEDTVMFEKLRCEAAQPVDKEGQLKEQLLKCKELYFRFYEPECDAAAIAVEILQQVSCVLFLYNGSYLKHGWDCLREEVLALEKIPACCEDAFDQLTQTADPQILKGVCRRLVAQTEVLAEKITPGSSEKMSVVEAYTGIYEHVKGLYEKTVAACFAAKAESALLYAKQLQEELDRAAARSEEVPQLPNLLDLYYRKDLSSFAVALYSHEAGLIGFLLNHGIQFEQYANLERFEEAECSKAPKTAQAEQSAVD